MIDKSLYVLDQLSDDSISIIELKSKRRIPTVLRKFMSEIGFLHNVIAGDWAQDEQSFVEMQEVVPNGYVAFMGDGCGNYYVTSDDESVLLWDHEDGKLHSQNCHFMEFIERYLREPEPIDSLSWQVQLSFDCSNETVIIDLLSKRFGLKTVGKWKFEEKSSAGVSSYILKYKSGNGDGSIGKLTNKDWEWDMISMDFTVPIQDIARYKRIFDELSSMNEIRFKLINYGILPTDLDDDDE
jgi:hypothetical protein